MTQRCCCGCCQVMTVAKTQAVVLSMASIALFSFMIAYYEYVSLEARIGVVRFFVIIVLHRCQHMTLCLFELIAAVLVFIACKKYKERLMIPMLVYCVGASSDLPRCSFHPVLHPLPISISSGRKR
ncbi:hypothetical protein PRIPAC_89121 [Pristionchus pacificus]|uniref:Uncharacterized protein n=1 Tax=Pristionchus pacificus TaxID=54126 RepID=A0A2A6CW53_PRIPA|nr:hypothetical protein PRIPAC_89121 [Pristionchus pacificus]|eukprot:PDM82462.1 hypothetical protein PRIPAC_36855 [Pristionchus pacificus]